MGSNHSHPVDIDPQALNNAENSWHNFTEATKVAVVGAVVVLGLMAFFLV